MWLIFWLSQCYFLAISYGEPFALPGPQMPPPCQVFPWPCQHPQGSSILDQTLQITYLPLKNLHSLLDHSTHAHPPVISQTIAVWFPDTALHAVGHSMEPKSGLLWWDFHAGTWQWPSVRPSGHPLMHPLAIWPSTHTLTLSHTITCKCYHHIHHHNPHIITHTTTYDMTIILSPHIAHVYHTTTHHTHIHTCITTT